MSMLKAGRPSKKDKAINAVQETNDGMVRMNINIPKPFHKEIKKFALEQDITVTELVKKALNNYMSR
jgi:hypothetical protein